MKIKLTLSSLALAVLIIVSVISLAVIAIIDSRVTNKLEGVLWTVPAKVYSRSLDLAEGLSINKSNLLRELAIFLCFLAMSFFSFGSLLKSNSSSLPFPTISFQGH